MDQYIKSRFKYSAYLLAFPTVLFAVYSLVLFFQNIKSGEIPVVFLIPISTFWVFVWIWMFFGDMRTKVISVEIMSDSIKVKRYLGLGYTKAYLLDSITGFKISIIQSKMGSYEYLYLMIGNRKIAKLSEFYHSNYKELKGNIISLGIKGLGTEIFSNRQEFKDIFSKT